MYSLQQKENAKQQQRKRVSVNLAIVLADGISLRMRNKVLLGQVPSTGISIDCRHMLLMLKLT